MWHHDNLRGVLASADQKGIRVFGGYFSTIDTKESDWASILQSIGTATEVSVAKAGLPEVGKEELGKHTAHDKAD